MVKVLVVLPMPTQLDIIVIGIATPLNETHIYKYSVI